MAVSLILFKFGVWLTDWLIDWLIVLALLDSQLLLVKVIKQYIWIVLHARKDKAEPKMNKTSDAELKQLPND